MPLSRTTEADTIDVEKRAAIDEQPMVVVAYHPNPAHLGLHAFVRETQPLELGRDGAALPPGVLDDPKLSRRHLEVWRAGGQVFARDVGSRNGTLHNGRALSAPAALAEGDVLSIGRMHLVCRAGPVYHLRPTHPVIVGVSVAVARMLEQIQRAAKGLDAVLIQGETGVGKELVAHQLHESSARGGPFVALNCGAVGDGVVHSELFGHVRGAFSGASDARAGLVEAAGGGTLFLDEIGDASPALQVSLLRLLELGEYRRVGSDEVRHAEVRFVAASHVPLQYAVDAGRFRRDLFSRLGGWVITVPALRDRIEDVVALAMHFAARRSGRSMRIGRRLASELLRHRWPANVRELQAVVTRLLASGVEGDELELYDHSPNVFSYPSAPPSYTSVPPPAQHPSQQPPSQPVPHARPPTEWLRDRFIALRGNMKVMSEELGVGRNTLYRWFREAGLDIAALRERL